MVCTPTWSSHSGFNVNESSSQCPVLGHPFVFLCGCFSLASVQRQEDDWSFWKSWSNRQFMALDTRIRRKYRIHVVRLSIFCLCWALGKPSYKVFMFCFVFIFPKKSLLPLLFFDFRKSVTRSLDVGSTSSPPCSTQFSELFRMTPQSLKSVQKQKKPNKSQNSHY